MLKKGGTRDRCRNEKKCGRMERNLVDHQPRFLLKSAKSCRIVESAVKQQDFSVHRFFQSRRSYHHRV